MGSLLENALSGYLGSILENTLSRVGSLKLVLLPLCRLMWGECNELLVAISVRGGNYRSVNRCVRDADLLKIGYYLCCGRKLCLIISKKKNGRKALVQMCVFINTHRQTSNPPTHTNVILKLQIITKISLERPMTVSCSRALGIKINVGRIICIKILYKKLILLHSGSLQLDEREHETRSSILHDTSPVNFRLKK